jgi:hypothetical protein
MARTTPKLGLEGATHTYNQSILTLTVVRKG